VTGLAAVPAVQADDYDLVILNGRVMDPETKLDAVRNVGIKDGKIAAVTKKAIEGRETIDAKGHVVAPGFLDTHNHNVLTPFGRKLALRDGLTTPMELENGVMPVAEWYDSMEGESQTNYAATASVMGARETVFNPNFKTIVGATINDIELASATHADMAWSTKVGTDKEIEKILSLLDQGLKDGALGIGHVPGYMVDGVTSRESFGTQQLAGKYGRFVAMHGRFSSQQPPTSGLLGTAEQVANVGPDRPAYDRAVPCSDARLSEIDR
jgi:N-acyl-D-aspartate/D-glutamate deacylase